MEKSINKQFLFEKVFAFSWLIYIKNLKIVYDVPRRTMRVIA